jgi:hypothetical protein
VPPPAKKKLAKKHAAKPSPRSKLMRTAQSFAALKRHGIFVSQVLICKKGESPKSCYLQFIGGPGAKADDPTNWTCVVPDGAKCSDGKECTRQAWTDEAGSHIACCRS